MIFHNVSQCLRCVADCGVSKCMLCVSVWATHNTVFRSVSQCCFKCNVLRCVIVPHCVTDYVAFYAMERGVSRAMFTICRSVCCLSHGLAECAVCHKVWQCVLSQCIVSAVCHLCLGEGAAVWCNKTMYFKSQKNKHAITSASCGILEEVTHTQSCQLSISPIQQQQQHKANQSKIMYSCSLSDLFMEVWPLRCVYVCVCVCMC